MTRVRWSSIALIFVVALPLAAAKDISGLWEGKLRFGPDVRGTLVIRREANAWSADFLGRTIAAREDGGVVTFELPAEQVSFRGRFDGPDIVGHWTQAPTVFAGRFVTPVRLVSEAAGRWRGDVQPFDDYYTIYLMLQPLEDGSYKAFIRNPERNFTLRWNVTRLTRDGRAIKLLGKRGESPETVQVDGTYDEERDLLSLSIANRGGTFDLRRAGDHSNFYPRGKSGQRYVYRPPLARNDGWPTSTVEAEGLDRAQIEAFIQWLIDMPIDSVNANEDHAVLIARHGKLVLEEYFHGEHRDRLHETRSAAKGLTSTLFGAAMYAGVPIDVSSSVYKIMSGGTLPSDLDPRKKAMTVEHLLTMSSGFDCDDWADEPRPGGEDTIEEQTEDADWYRYTLNLPMAHAPGESAEYCSINPNLVGGLLRRVTGEPLQELFDRLIARPMQFGRYAMRLQPLGDPYMGGGVHLLPRDFMKFGQLMLDGGTWHGKRILSEAYVKRASSPIMKLGRSWQYGYLWWFHPFPYKDRKVDAYSMNGNGGQVVVVVPELDLVIAYLGGNYGDSAGFNWARTYTPNRVLPAVK